MTRAGAYEPRQLAHDAASQRGGPEHRHKGIGILAILLALLALLTPLGRAQVYGRVGLLLVLAAALEIAHGFRRSTVQGQRSAWFGGAITVAMGLLLIQAPYLAVAALWLFLAGWFGLDGIRYLVETLRARHRGISPCCDPRLSGQPRRGRADPRSPRKGRGLDGGHCRGRPYLRDGLEHSRLTRFHDPPHGGLGCRRPALADNPEMSALAQRLADEETARAPIDRGWILGFLATLLAIHVGRMGFDRTFLGIVAPGFAVLGDLMMALLLAFAVVIPFSVLSRRLTRGPERWLWGWCLKVPGRAAGVVAKGRPGRDGPSAPLLDPPRARRAIPRARP